MDVQFHFHPIELGDRGDPHDLAVLGRPEVDRGLIDRPGDAGRGLGRFP